MRRVATGINDRKRRLESLQKLALWQSTIVDWPVCAPDLLCSSSRLVHYGDIAVRALNGARQSLWCRDVVAYIFDACCVLCRRDLLARTRLIYKHRLSTQDCEACVDVADGRCPVTGAAVKHAIRLNMTEHSAAASSIRYYIFMCRNRKTKQRWLQVSRVCVPP
jgi:hypothetical protein